MPCCSIRPARIRHHQVGQRQGLVLAMGDMDEADHQLALAALESRPAPGREGKGRAPKAVVQQQRRRVVTRARARATRCCWPPDSSAGSRAAKPSSSDQPQRVARVGVASRPADAAHRQEKATLSSTTGAGTAHRSGTSSPCRGGPAAGGRTRRPAGFRRSVRSHGRPSAAASWSCRSPMARAGSSSCPSESSGRSHRRRPHHPGNAW